MKHLCSTHSPINADSISSLLESKGIPVVRSNVGMRQLLKASRVQIDLWVGLDSQYQDALALMMNPSHQVSNPVDVDEFHRHLEEFKGRPFLSQPTVDKFAAILVGLFLVGFGSWVLWAIFGT